MSVALKEGREAALEVLERYLPEPADHGTVLSGRGLSKSFGGLQAVRDVSLDVPARSFVGLIGPNGAGKSTLFNLLNGFLPPDAGQVTLFGRDATRLQPWDRARLGLSRTFQANHIDVNLTTFENLLAGAYLRIGGGLVRSVLRTNHADDERARQTVRAVARLLDLELVLDVTARALDFGAQRRIEIGRSLMSAPRILLLDEPTAGVDSREALEIVSVVKRLQTDLGLAVLLIEHYVQAVLETCDPIYALVEGSVVAAGPPAVIAADPKVRSSYLGE
ncbi:MAG TPA: ATP-binding cassette domain-containing protein [Acidimicrobiia bacterium]|jgi:ABC-type branched-subunit amino acid transport system ATPase component